MKLNFLGRGSAFNPKEGNTSAYFIENNELFLIDCGETVFTKLIQKDLLNNINNINVLITHTHSDHIGSLGSLVMYSYYYLKKPLNIIITKDAKYLRNIEGILKGFGCTNEMYNYILEKEYDNKFISFEKIRYIETKHCDELNCYGIIFVTNNGIVYYSGDTCEIEIIKKLIFSEEKIDKIYIDASSTLSSVHLYIGKLIEEIPEKYRNKVYCMHFNDEDCIKLVLKSKFKIV